MAEIPAPESPRVEPTGALGSEDVPDRDLVALDDGARESGGALIVLAGLEGTGKTTLVASIYERFLTGRFSRCSFRRSRTLRAFEDRCFRARVASGRHQPTTPRTEQSEGLQVLHLGIRAEERDPEAVNLLFADMSGEYFRRARDSAEECRNLTILKRTDHLVLLVDGRLLCDRSQREAALNDTRVLLRRFVECDMVGKLTSVQIVASKWDLVLRGGVAPEVQERLNAL